MILPSVLSEASSLVAERRTGKNKAKQRNKGKKENKEWMKNDYKDLKNERGRGRVNSIEGEITNLKE